MPVEPRSRVFVLRHAHSSWALPGQRDHERPLDARGLRDAPLVGAQMVRLGYRFDRIVCSTALRATQTLDAIREHLGAGIAEEFSDDLYALGCDAYYAAVRERGAASILLVGHNPMVEEFTASLAPRGEARALRGLKDGFPTAGLAVIDLSAPLSAIAQGNGYLARLIDPHDLGGSA